MIVAFAVWKIYHKRLRQNIFINGRHEAIAVEIDGQKLIFDNIHPEDISRVDWKTAREQGAVLAGAERVFRLLHRCGNITN
ncbi:MAG: papain fold toxin domain-containing protein [Nostoc sp.]|uniref:papain fold toxin domain-containing protein n=1 Tax=Nostoc sp. TaxID=1180 RepID=UPI002FEEF247